MDPHKISILDYTYDLPNEKIAFHPLEKRDASRLLIYKDETISEDHYLNIDHYLPSDSLIIFNNTKVVEARLLFQKESGASIEIFCLDPDEQYPDIVTAFGQQQSVIWNCLIGGASKWRAGQILSKKVEYKGQTVTLSAKCLEKKETYFSIQLFWTPEGLSFAEVLHACGAIPLPPYIKRAADKEDEERYQTVYAQKDGSVAAPTAGLHFTPAILDRLEKKKIETLFVTLHVGAGTFKPVKASQMADHDMHAEFIDVSAETINFILNNLSKKITVVGTTSLRTIESLYWLGVKSIIDKTISLDSLKIQQWDPYELKIPGEISVALALQSLLDWMKQNKKERLITTTQLLIAPGYRFKIVDFLVTNFHQPQSTLLLLVAALVGDDWRRIYQYALENGFRFLSYGDGCLLQRR
jgi:S-adenosylmethionine:tRNA ribosyltransferase-isomerase